MKTVFIEYVFFRYLGLSIANAKHFKISQPLTIISSSIKISIPCTTKKSVSKKKQANKTKTNLATYIFKKKYHQNQSNPCKFTNFKTKQKKGQLKLLFSSSHAKLKKD